MLVKAKRVGFYAGLIRKEGDQFPIGSKDELGSWMEPVQKPKAKTVKKAAPKVEKPSAE
jgi:hypothetical protein